jgi:hypothetical protein
VLSIGARRHIEENTTKHRTPSENTKKKKSRRAPKENTKKNKKKTQQKKQNANEHQKQTQKKKKKFKIQINEPYFVKFHVYTFFKGFYPLT